MAADRQALTERLESFVAEIDFRTEETYLLEMAYLGADVSDVETFNEVVDEVLGRLVNETEYRYWAGIQSGILFLLVEPNCRQ